MAEIGTFLGGSAETLLEAMPEDGHLITIDTFRGTPGSWAQPKNGPNELAAFVSIRLARFAGRFTIIMGTSLDAADYVEDSSLDLVFIDGAHDYANVLTDLDTWLPKVKPTGVISGHDFEPYLPEGCTHRDVRKRAHVDHDPMTNIHYGVLAAVMDTFTRVESWEDGSDGKESTVWWAKPEWARKLA